MMLTRVTSLLALAAACASALSPLRAPGLARARSAFSVRVTRKTEDHTIKEEGEPLTLETVAGYWELQEAEDDMTAHTLVHLLPGGGVDLGKTDGPVPEDFVGAWRVLDESTWDFELTLKRTFADGRFPYNVERTYSGFIEDGGSLRTVEGKITIDDQARGPIEAGYFCLTNVQDFPDDEEAAE
eukprot:CAMPEP_0119413824 /NCGR_PEP_ID=MMETSP1335-20130426/6108_1 /TAXON_ID=259385 /ORGANISM="Chrysoculter rhomboideus, Strain RCC1486" /LENGTH=183 /DNA_ID=CAMNT_0007438651 /DNA_START=59 /DNA_END=610 /DNA_ORIENTATION=+